ncbi:MAG: hypothetical protein RJQ04_20805 [Longimicrobiales bacterium]
MVALVDGIDALEARMEALRPSTLRITARVGTYFGVLAALTVGLVDPPQVVPWMAATFVAACIPDVSRYLRYRSLTRERDLLVERGAQASGGRVDPSTDSLGP